MSELEPTRTYSNPTATEELRRLLDERGVEYRVSATGYSIDIGPSITAYANRTDTTLDVSLRGFTPEQAIDATLGRGTCKRIDSPNDDEGRPNLPTCSECGEELSYTDRYCPSCGAKVVEE